MGWAGFVLLPWYGVDDGILDPAWLTDGWAWDTSYAPALFQGLWHGKPWLLPLGLFLALPVLALRWGGTGRAASTVLIAAGVGGLAWWLGQGFAIGLRGIQWGWLAAARRPGVGATVRGRLGGRAHRRGVPVLPDPGLGGARARQGRRVRCRQHRAR